jgi:hypothetical protein
MMTEEKEERLYKHLKAVDERAQEGAKDLKSRLDMIAGDVRELLVRDVDHERRIGGLERVAADAGRAAGGKSGLGMGALGSAVVTIVIAIVEVVLR